MSEKQWQAAVVELAQWLGWRVYHPYYSARSAPGWPDLALVRQGRLILAELKTNVGRVTREQRRWLEDLDAVPHVEVHVWRPKHWPEVQQILRAERAGDGGVWLQQELAR